MKKITQIEKSLIKFVFSGAVLFYCLVSFHYVFYPNISIQSLLIIATIFVAWGFCGYFAGSHSKKVRQREECLQDAFNEVWQSAYYDKLTGLPNRTLMLDRLSQEMAHSRRLEESMAFLIVDIDRFKRVNETYGYNTGDNLLLLAAERMASTIRESDTVARIGGDEYAIMLPRISNPDDAALVAAKVLDTIAFPMDLEEGEVFCTCSIGIAMFPTDGNDAETILKHADIAMHNAKSGGGRNYRFYSLHMDQQATERLAMESNMQRGLERGDFFLHYQPQVDVETGAIIGLEALLRWNNPEIGSISPSMFIPLAEETGFILPLGNWVLHRACEQAVEWQKAGFAPVRMAVNLSPRQFCQKDLVKTVADTLAMTGLPPWLLELELTESCFVDRPDEAMLTLHELKALGIRIAIDDFGTGYSSLSYLKLFPIDHLKIAMPFVRDITTNPDDAAIVEAIIKMAHTMNIKVIAEGVETTAQKEFLLSNNCDFAQGYLFSRPIPGEEISRQLECIQKEADDETICPFWKLSNASAAC